MLSLGKIVISTGMYLACILTVLLVPEPSVAVRVNVAGRSRHCSRNWFMSMVVVAMMSLRVSFCISRGRESGDVSVLTSRRREGSGEEGEEEDAHLSRVERQVNLAKVELANQHLTDLVPRVVRRTTRFGRVGRPVAVVEENLHERKRMGQRQRRRERWRRASEGGGDKGLREIEEVETEGKKVMEGKKGTGEGRAGEEKI